jgi:LPXTG-site transpeptidase (sortase) family protein
MASKRYKKLLTIRFIAYFISIIGSLAITFQFGPVLDTEFNYRKDALFNVHHSLSPTVITSNQNSPSPVPGNSGTTNFGSAIDLSAGSITPVSTDFGIVIEKINANSKVIPQVDPANKTEYTNALAMGVAEALGSTAPGQPGNLYIFSHSVDAPWNVIRYNAVFYLLRELAVGDRVVLFYKDRRYDYIVFDKTVVDPNDVSFLTNRYDKPVLTLQTCDPPGTLAHRLIVRAQLAGS